MSSRQIQNPYPDYLAHGEYVEAFIINGKVSDVLAKKCVAAGNAFLAKIEDQIPYIDCHSDSSVYTGYCGYALLFYLVARRQNDPQYIKKAFKLVQKSMENLKVKRYSFLNGAPGAMALWIVLQFKEGMKKEADDSIKDLLTLVDKVVGDSCIPDEVLYGRSGFLYALLFVNRHIGGDTIPPEEIRKVIESILHRGSEQAKKKANFPAPLYYEWHDKVYYGAAHGYAGILYSLLLVDDLLTYFEKNSLIKPTLDWLVTETYPSGNFLSSQGSETDRLVQWCHGAPGFVHLLLRAHTVYKDENYLNLATKCCDIIWERGLLSKGYSICHGVSGNAYSFLALFQNTQKEKHLYRAVCFAEWCLKYPKHQSVQPDRPLSLYEGIAGVAYLLFDILQPNRSSFPAYEL